MLQFACAALMSVVLASHAHALGGAAARTALWRLPVQEFLSSPKIRARLIELGPSSMPALLTEHHGEDFDAQFAYEFSPAVQDAISANLDFTPVTALVNESNDEVKIRLVVLAVEQAQESAEQAYQSAADAVVEALHHPSDRALDLAAEKIAEVEPVMLLLSPGHHRELQFMGPKLKETKAAFLKQRQAFERHLLGQIETGTFREDSIVVALQKHGVLDAAAVLVPFYEDRSREIEKAPAGKWAAAFYPLAKASLPPELGPEKASGDELRKLQGKMKRSLNTKIREFSDNTALQAAFSSIKARKRAGKSMSTRDLNTIYRYYRALALAASPQPRYIRENILAAMQDPWKAFGVARREAHRRAQATREASFYGAAGGAVAAALLALNGLLSWPAAILFGGLVLIILLVAAIQSFAAGTLTSLDADSVVSKILASAGSRNIPD